MKRDELYDQVCEVFDSSPMAIFDLVTRYGHLILFLPPYHSDFNPIENVWGIVKGYVTHNHTQFAKEEVECLVKEGINFVTPKMWQKAIEKVEEMEEEVFINDVYDDIIQVE